MVMAHATKHAMRKLWSIVSKLVDESWHAFVHGSFEFGIVVWVRFVAKSIDAALVRLTTTAVAKWLALST